MANTVDTKGVTSLDEKETEGSSSILDAVDAVNTGSESISDTEGLTEEEKLEEDKKAYIDLLSSL